MKPNKAITIRALFQREGWQWGGGPQGQLERLREHQKLFMCRGVVDVGVDAGEC